MQQAAKLNRERKKRTRRHKVVSFLAAIVVFCTTYALILPAITMEPDYICGYEEHTHSDECYELRPYNVMTCTAHAHEHTSECPDNCPYASFLVHKHISFCYDADGKLICSLPVNSEHTHTDACYKITQSLSEKENAEETDVSEEDSTDTQSDIRDNAAQDEENGSKVEDVETKKELICTLPEIKLHTHTDSCFDSNGEVICNQTEILEHIHSAECFTQDYKKVLVCDIPEHTHDDLLCLSDPTADIETEADWLLTLPAKKTGDLCTDLLATAKSQLGYRESVTNRNVGENGTIYGYSRYGAWHKSPYEPWNTTFMSFCMHYTNADIFDNLLRPTAKELNILFVNCGIFDSSKDHTPVAGEIIFLDMNKDGTADHVGCVSGMEGNSPTVILGDFNNEVAETVFDDSDVILGYGLVSEISENGFPDVIYNNNSSSSETSTGVVNNNTQAAPEKSDNLIGEEANDIDNFLKLEDDGFYTYWEQYLENPTLIQQNSTSKATFSAPKMRAVNAASIYTDLKTDTTSETQIIKHGGSNTSEDGLVSVSKTAEGTDIENVFDITLKVNSQTHLEIFKQDPDMAIVIVMDISNTMLSNYGSTSRYAAAIEAAESFIDKFDENAPDGTNASLGFVAFNTSGHKIFDLQDCTNATQATKLKNDLRQKTGNIINVTDYASKHTRFTNIEAGLAMAYDMLNKKQADNKFIIFLSDGFPTTYMKTNTTTYEGYDPYCTSGTPGKDGVFYDSVNKTYCLYGTSYSDKAAIRASAKAAAIKGQGAKIFSIGVDVAGQNLQTYINQSSGKSYSVVDRTGTTYEIGAANSSDSFKNWLKNKIGSGYYYDSNNKEQLTAAFQTIFDEIKRLQIEQTTSIWAAVDPLPMHTDDNMYIEFIHFFDKDGLPQQNLSGTYTENGENTATYDEEANTIHWDLKYSGYHSYQEGNITHYEYEVKYRVRLENEEPDFIEHSEYYTNDTTVLSYQDVTITNGKPVYSEVKTVEFPLPSVKGYLGEFSFKKIDHNNAPLEDVTFTLTHDSIKCTVCHGDNTFVSTVGPYTAVSDKNGTVSFTKIPSGHIYTLSETTPENYKKNTDTYSVTVTYDELTVTVTHEDGTSQVWENNTSTVVNIPEYAPDSESIIVSKKLSLSDGTQPSEMLLNSSVFTFRILQADKDGNPTDKPFFAPGIHYDIIENGVSVGTGIIADDGTFTLKANQAAVFSQLISKGGSEKYVVQELIKSNTADDYTQVLYLSKNIEYTPVISTDGEYNTYTTTCFERKDTESIIFSNTADAKELASLEVSKKLASGTSNTNETFTFLVELNGSPIPVGTKYTVGSVTRTVTTAGIIELKANETAIIDGISPGTKYKVTEIISADDKTDKTVKNLAPGKKITVSDPNWDINTSRINDGVKNNANLYWDGGIGPAYFTIDLGAKCQIERFVQYGYWTDSRSYHYKVYVSDNGTDFTLVADTGYIQATSSGNTIYPDTPRQARYVRLEIMKNTKNNYTHSVEFEIYGYVIDDSVYEAVYTGTVSEGGTFSTDGSSAEGTLPTSASAQITVTNKKHPFSATVPIEKTALSASGENTFDFSLEAVEYGTWTPLSELNGTSITTTDTDTAYGNIRIGFDADTTGKFYYKISEKKGSLSFIYDETFYIVEVTAAGYYAYVSAVYKNGTDLVENQTASFTNERKTDLYISKTVDAPDTEGEFPFTATVTLNGEPVILPTPPQDANYTVEQNVIHFTLKHNENIIIRDLPYGASVVVSEEIPEKTYSPFYKIEGENILIIPGTSVTVALDTDIKTVRFINKAYYEIPATGGMGTLPLILTGLVTVCGTLTYYGKRKKHA